MLKFTYKTVFEKQFNEIYGLKNTMVLSMIFIIIFLLIDLFDLINKFNNMSVEIKILVVVIGILACVLLINKKFINHMKFKAVNILDFFLVSILCSSIIYSGIYYFSKSNTNNINIFLTIIFATLLVLIFRIIRIGSCSEKIDYNVYSLSDLINNKIEMKSHFLLNDELESEDLLNRGKLIEYIIDIIQNCKNRNKYVIGLKGPWGSGKTTIISHIKKDESFNDFIIIDNFEFWKYQDEKSLLRGMIDSVLSKIDLRLIKMPTNEIIENTMDLIFYNDSSFVNKVSSILTNFCNNGVQNIALKTINHYLTKTNKKMLFIIDNIERGYDSNILFLFNCISNVLNFDNTIYLLSYDEKRLKKHLLDLHKVDYEYMRKIVQLEIDLPVIDDNIMIDLIYKSLICSFNIFNIDYDSNKLFEIARTMNKYIRNVRDLKVFINSAICFKKERINKLNLYDYLLINVVRIMNNALYFEIRKDYNYFVSDDRRITGDWITNENEFNTEAKEYFNKLFLDKKNNEYIPLLSILFPYVDRYNNGREISKKPSDIAFEINNKDNTSKFKRICSARYFNVYFSYAENEYTLVDSWVEDFLNVINTSSYNEVISFIDNNLLSQNSYFQKLFMESLDNSLKNNIKQDALYGLTCVLTDYYNKFDDSMVFLELDAHSRSSAIISSLIFKLSDEQLKEYFNTKFDSISKLELLDHIKYWVNSSYESNENKERILVLINDKQDLIINKIFKSKIDIYLDENYTCKNNYALYHYCNEKGPDSLSQLKTYYASIINKNNIIRFLRDCLGEAVSTLGFEYDIKYSDVETFIEITKVEDLVSSLDLQTKTEDEKEIVRIFQLSKGLKQFEHAVRYPNRKTFKV